MSGASARSWSRLLGALLQGGDLTADDTSWAMDQVMSGQASPAQVAGFLVALRAKGETVGEVRGLADTMRRFAVPISVHGPTLDIVGTGGDGAHTVNISTMAAIVSAGAGARVVKHGNRASSSSSGAADVLEALGIALDLPADRIGPIATEVGITFCFSQTFHPSMRYAAVPRRELGIPTAFNILGPLTNPARPRYSAVGAADPRVADLIAGVFAERGSAAAVFRGDDGLDELSVATTSSVRWVRDGEISQHRVDPAEVGIAPAGADALRGGDALHNAGVVREVLAGATGPVRDAVVLNAGIALAVADEDGSGRFGAHASFGEALGAGVARARTAIDDGAAARSLDQWVAATRRA
ncbi:anthranilate phosphoribosyltransferase [Allobranchiibius sp. GilTou73]|uniref:anthranilate phosphoribosyltransferase n=1 Tax=Allobranchiibius sp. GilTou73 TaxID=2904523 RepID=UPI001F2C5E37|nr:anthranilate phosphoribosyltransferase [Allobranchiibius sp. GilTou73]UIJ33596.1 anthranilate phosphoribosyltransferase [Allobranchiibius sp. GilTou73]